MYNTFYGLFLWAMLSFFVFLQTIFTIVSNPTNITFKHLACMSTHMSLVIVHPRSRIITNATGVHFSGLFWYADIVRRRNDAIKYFVLLIIYLRVFTESPHHTWKGNKYPFFIEEGKKHRCFIFFWIRYKLYTSNFRQISNVHFLWILTLSKASYLFSASNVKHFNFSMLHYQSSMRSF